MSVGLFVCLSVCLHISEITLPNFTTFSIHITFGLGSDLHCQHHVLPFLWVTSYFTSCSRWARSKGGTYVSSSSPGGGTEVCHLRLFWVRDFVVCVQMQTNRPLSHCVPATKSASWTECANAFRDTNSAVILTNNQDFSGNEPVLLSSLEIDELCNKVIPIFVFNIYCQWMSALSSASIQFLAYLTAYCLHFCLDVSY